MVDASFNDAMTDMKYTFASLDQTKNEIIVTCHPRSVGAAPTTLWELKDAVIRVAPGETREVYVKYKDEEGQAHRRQGCHGRGCRVPPGGCTVAVEAKAMAPIWSSKTRATGPSHRREVRREGPQDRWTRARWTRAPPTRPASPTSVGAR